MHLYYLSFSRIPTEKAHGLTIVKSCEAFAANGIQVTLVLPRRTTHLTEDLYTTYGVEKNFEVQYLPTLDLLQLTSSALAFWLSFTTFYLSTCIMMLFIKRSGAVIYTRDVPLISLSYFGIPVVFECHHLFARARRSRLLRRARAIVTISAALKNALLVLLPHANILVAPSGFDPAIFSTSIDTGETRRELKLPDRYIACYTGNFTSLGEDKGISDILKAMVELPNVFFVAVGGSDKDRVRYEGEARALGILDRVRLAGYASQPTLARYQAAADVLLMPFPNTPHYRNHMSPVKMFEYMASGKPIIATDLPTIREVLGPETAVIVPPGDPQALARAIMSLKVNPTLAQSLGARAKAESGAYSWDKRAKKVITFLAGAHVVG